MEQIQPNELLALNRYGLLKNKQKHIWGYSIEWSDAEEKNYLWGMLQKMLDHAPDNIPEPHG